MGAGHPETYLNPGFSFAPAAGRFAFGRTTTAAIVGDAAIASVGAGQYSSDVVTVFQTDSGKQIFRLECSPVLPAGQNFALSPDGADLALIRNSAIEIYHLPPLSAKDRAGIAKAASLAPEPTEGPVLINTLLSNAGARAATSAGAAVPTPPTDPVSHRPSAIVDSDTVLPTDAGSAADTPAAPAPTAEAGTPQPASAQPAAAVAPDRPATATIENGDPQPQTDVPRNPPTLYAPGEQPDTTQDKSNPK